MRRLPLLLGTLATLTSISACSAPPTVDEPSVFARAGHGDAVDRGRSIVRRVMRDREIPGASVSVLKGRSIVWSEGFGKADLELDVPVTRETRFRLGSVSKIFTGTLAARLRGDGRFDPDRSVREYVPLFPDKGRVITSRQLLTHTGGIRHYIPRDQDFNQPGSIIDFRQYPNTASALALFASDPLLSDPGSTYSYSTFGFTLLQAAMEGATRTSFRELLAEEITRPLRLDSVRLDDMFEVVHNRTDFYTPHPLGRDEIVPAFTTNQAYKWAGGGMIGTPDDLARFGAAHFSPGYLSESAYAELFEIQRTSSGELTGVGFAWRVDEDSEGRQIRHHSGSQNGCRAFLIVYPDHELAIAMMTNLTQEPRNIREIVEQIAQGFLRR